MLSFFPTPYPDETWYSIIGRYHIRSGNLYPIRTMLELFGKEGENIISLIPNNSMIWLLSKLPEGFISAEDMILNHTLFKFATRFIPYEEKIQYLEEIKKGESHFPSKICQGAQKIERLKYCPFCLKEDVETYGESYWHLKHQIPLVTTCYKHKCRLITKEFSKKQGRYHFWYPGENRINEIKAEPLEHEKTLTKIAVRYQELPLDVCPKKEYNNLYLGLLNAGYGMVWNSGTMIMNKKKLTEKLCKIYGTEQIKQIFHVTDLKQILFQQIQKWYYKSPEKYLLLATLLKQDPDVTFKEEVSYQLAEEFLKLSKDSKFRTKEYVAEKLNVKTSYLNTLAEIVGIKPFWEDKIVKEEECVIMQIRTTQEERERIKKYAKEHGFTYLSHFIKHCIETVMVEEHKKNGV